MIKPLIQLNDKDLSELQSIAKELGIKKTDSLKKEDLVYKILDEQAIVGAATFCTGLLFERSRKSWSSAFFASLAGAVILYVVGLPYFYGIMTLYLQQAMTVSQLFAVYCLPTLPGDVIKCIVCASVVGRLRTALSQKLPV